MSLQHTKELLLSLTRDPENRVIALSGKWGTGKTHLIGEVTEAAEDESLAGALSVSLFGLSSIDQVKRKLIESVAPGAEAHPKIWEGAKQAVTTALKALEGFHKGFAALSDLNLLLLAPTMLGGKVIVIDDIERKHDKLGVDEILGFIDEYTQKHKARFILLLNSDQLANRTLWDTFREKVIDQEVKLLTTPEEAFAIAVAAMPSPYADAIKAASIICKLTNIRIIRRVIKVANQILGERELEPALLERVIPSIVLFSAIHYKGIDKGPDFQFALKIGSADWDKFLDKEDGAEPTEEDSNRVRWEALMQELHIHSCDEFELLLVEYLESGLFDDSKLTPIIDRYVAEKDLVEARQKANDFLYKEFWDHSVDDATMLQLAQELPGIAPLLDPFMCSELEIALREVPGADGVGQAVIDAWIAGFRANPPENINFENPFNKPLHASIAAEFDAAEAQAQASTTVLDACMYIIDRSGWGTRQKIALQGATAADFEAAIRTMEVEKLHRFMRRMMEMRIQHGNYDHHFGSATQRFVEACRAIVNDAASPRLGRLIKRLYAPTVLAAELNPPEPEAPAAA
ncbi:MAG TPA: P-loop NTPase fold protein [Roseateles sp.]|nr:P-loop NTPase fold protein [Roseateles sp.]